MPVTLEDPVTAPTRPPDRAHGYSGREVCALAGITYRQLDYLARTRRIPDFDGTPGSGNRRRWSADLARRISVAACIHRFSPTWGQSADTVHSFPFVAGVVLDGPPPPATGWAITTSDGAIAYTVDADGLIDTIPVLETAPVGTAVLVVRYDVSQVEPDPAAMAEVRQ